MTCGPHVDHISHHFSPWDVRQWQVYDKWDSVHGMLWVWEAPVGRPFTDWIDMTRFLTKWNKYLNEQSLLSEADEEAETGPETSWDAGNAHCLARFALQSLQMAEMALWMERMCRFQRRTRTSSKHQTNGKNGTYGYTWIYCILYIICYIYIHMYMFSRFQDGLPVL